MHHPSRFFNSSKCSELCSFCGWNPAYLKPINTSTSPVGLVVSSFATFLNRRCTPSKFIVWMSEVILSMPYTSICNSCPFLSIGVNLYLRDINFSLTLPALTTDSWALIPVSFSSLAVLFVMKQREAPLPHNTLVNPFFLWILWTCRRHNNNTCNNRGIDILYQYLCCYTYFQMQGR